MGWAPNWVSVSNGVAVPGTSITSIARYPQHLDLFCVGADNGIYSSSWDISTAATGWANWFRVAGGVVAPGTTIAVVARNPNHLDLFAVGSDHRVYSISWDANGGWAGSWFRVTDMAVAPGASVTAVVRNPDHLDLFVVGVDNKIYSIWWDSRVGWQERWYKLFEQNAANGTSIAALRRKPNHFDLFAVGLDNRIYSIWWDVHGGWASWYSVARGAAAQNTSIAAVARDPTHMDLFAVGTDYKINSISWDANGGWAPRWFNVSGGVAAPDTSVSVVSRHPNQLDVFAVGGNSVVYNVGWDARSGWGSWFQIAEEGTSVNALSRYPDILDVFIVGTDQHIETIRWLDEIYFSMQHQQQSNWCWAAAATSVALFYQPASGWTQCQVANDQLGRTDCCGAGASGPCNVISYLDQAFTVVGHFDHWVDGVASIAQIETAVTFARPLGIRVAWSGGGAHFLCIMGHYGAGGIDYVTVDDPIYGRSDVNYTTLQTAYQGTGTWTHTYYTKY